MRKGSKTRITYLCGALIFMCLLAISGLDAFYSHNPSSPNLQRGEIIERTLKYQGHIYLTRAEYESYKWVYAIGILCALFLALIYVIDYFQTKIKN